MTFGGFRERFVVCGEDMLSLRMVEALLRQSRRGATDVVVLTAPGGAVVDRLRAIGGVEVVEVAEPDDETFRAVDVGSATCVAFVHRDDVVNIHRALRVQELAPSVRLVVRLHAPALSGRIRMLLPTATVLSVSATAAPAFVTAAIGARTHQSVDLPGYPMVVADRADVRPAAVVTGLAHRPHRGAPELLPTREAAADLVLARVARHRQGRLVGTRRAAWRRVLTLMWRRTRASMTRSLARATLGLLALLVLGTVAFATLADLSWGDAIYLTVLDSAGAADPDTHVSAVARTVQALVTLVGIAIIPLVTAVVVDAAVSARFAGTPQRPRPRRGHVVVVGLGNVGVRVVEQLHERGVPVVAVDDDEGPGVSQIRRMGLPVIVGDTTRRGTLAEASVDDCRALVAVGRDDVANLETGLVGRSLRSRLRVVLRLRDDDLARRVERSLEVAVSRSVSFLAAPAFAAAMRDHKVVATVPVGRSVLLLADVPIGRSALLAGLPASAAESEGEVRVVGVYRGAAHDAVLDSPPRPQRRLKVGDRLVVAATRTGLAEVHARCAARTSL
ncbi:NAD-binding protein [Actinomycetospora sp. CA-053990]|uniref:NAD-binding protein n=1 Tax=Actinomycetospora sp. CA-053990 TaxID=3239891 RepID=UPI003D8A363A